MYIFTSRHIYRVFKGYFQFIETMLNVDTFNCSNFPQTNKCSCLLNLIFELQCTYIQYIQPFALLRNQLHGKLSQSLCSLDTRNSYQKVGRRIVPYSNTSIKIIIAKVNVFCKRFAIFSQIYIIHFFHFFITFLLASFSFCFVALFLSIIFCFSSSIFFCINRFSLIFWYLKKIRILVCF